MRCETVNNGCIGSKRNPQAVLCSDSCGAVSSWRSWIIYLVHCTVLVTQTWRSHTDRMRAGRLRSQQQMKRFDLCSLLNDRGECYETAGEGQGYGEVGRTRQACDKTRYVHWLLEIDPALSQQHRGSLPADSRPPLIVTANMEP